MWRDKTEKALHAESIFAGIGGIAAFGERLARALDAQMGRAASGADRKKIAAQILLRFPPTNADPAEAFRSAAGIIARIPPAREDFAEAGASQYLGTADRGMARIEELPESAAR